MVVPKKITSSKKGILSSRAHEDIRGLPIDLRAAVFEHLSRIGANHATCSCPTSFPHPVGLESGLWLRRRGGEAQLLEVLFDLTANSDGVHIRRVLLGDSGQLPDWVRRPSEWSAHEPWPVVDV